MQLGGFFHGGADEPRNTRKARKGFRARNFCMNGGITVFETRFPRVSQKQESTAVPRTRCAQTGETVIRLRQLFRPADRLVPIKVSNTITAAAASVGPSIYSCLVFVFLPEYRVAIFLNGCACKSALKIKLRPKASHIISRIGGMK